jgi:hypothetical protein
MARFFFTLYSRLVRDKHQTAMDLGANGIMNGVNGHPHPQTGIVEHEKDVTAAEHHLSDLDVREPLDTNTLPLTIAAATIQSQRLIITLTDSPKPLPPPESLVFGKV